MQERKPVRVDDKRFPIVFRHHIQDDAGDNEQQARDYQHHRANQSGEASYHAGMYELHRDRSA